MALLLLVKRTSKLVDSALTTSAVRARQPARLCTKVSSATGLAQRTAGRRTRSAQGTRRGDANSTGLANGPPAVATAGLTVGATCATRSSGTSPIAFKTVFAGVAATSLPALPTIHAMTSATGPAAGPAGLACCNAHAIDAATSARATVGRRTTAPTHSATRLASQRRRIADSIGRRA